MGNINMHERVATGRALGILGNLVHFRHSVINDVSLLFQGVEVKIKYRIKYALSNLGKGDLSKVQGVCEIYHLRPSAEELIEIMGHVKRDKTGSQKHPPVVHGQ